MATVASVADWKKVLKDNPGAVDSAALTRALEEYGRASGKDDPGDRLDALKSVIDRARAVKKKNATSKDLAKFLDGVIGDAEKTLSRASSEKDEDDEEAEAGAQLRSQLVRVKKVDVEAARPFVLALGAVAGLVIGKRPPITRDQRKTAKEMRTGKGKLLTGVCYGDGGKYVFELEDKPPGGLTKVIKKAAKVHAQMTIQLKVRGGGHELDDETDLEELTDFGEERAEDDKAAEDGNLAPTVPPAEGASKQVWEQRLGDVETRYRPATGNKYLHIDVIKEMHVLHRLALGKAKAADYGSALRELATLETLLDEAEERSARLFVANFEEMSRAVQPRLVLALKENRGDTARMRAVFGFAREKAEAGQHRGAVQALTQLEGLLKGDGAQAVVKGDVAFQKKWLALQPRLLKALKEDRGDKKQLKDLFEFARQKAEVGAYDLGRQALTALESALDGVMDQAEAEAVAWRLKRDAVKQLVVRIAELRDRKKMEIEYGENEHLFAHARKKGDAGEYKPALELLAIVEKEFAREIAKLEPTADKATIRNMRLTPSEEDAYKWHQQSSTIEARLWEYRRETYLDTSEMDAMFRDAEEKAGAGQRQAAREVLRALEPLIDTAATVRHAVKTADGTELWVRLAVVLASEVIAKLMELKEVAKGWDAARDVADKGVMVNMAEELKNEIKAKAKKVSGYSALVKEAGESDEAKTAVTAVEVEAWARVKAAYNPTSKAALKTKEAAKLAEDVVKQMVNPETASGTLVSALEKSEGFADLENLSGALRDPIPGTQPEAFFDQAKNSHQIEQFSNVPDAPEKPKEKKSKEEGATKVRAPKGKKGKKKEAKPKATKQSQPEESKAPKLSSNPLLLITLKEQQSDMAGVRTCVVKTLYVATRAKRIAEEAAARAEEHAKAAEAASTEANVDEAGAAVFKLNLEERLAEEAVKAAACELPRAHQALKEGAKTADYILELLGADYDGAPEKRVEADAVATKIMTEGKATVKSAEVTVAATAKLLAAVKAAAARARAAFEKAAEELSNQATAKIQEAEAEFARQRALREQGEEGDPDRIVTMAGEAMKVAKQAALAAAEVARKVAAKASEEEALAAQAARDAEGAAAAPADQKERRDARAEAEARAGVAVAAAKQGRMAAAATTLAAGAARKAAESARRAVAAVEEIRELVPEETAEVFKAGEEVMKAVEEAEGAAVAATKAADAAAEAEARATAAAAAAAENEANDAKNNVLEIEQNMARLLEVENGFTILDEGHEKYHPVNSLRSIWPVLVGWKKAASESAAAAVAAAEKVSAAAAAADEAVLGAQAAADVALLAAQTAAVKAAAATAEKWKATATEAAVGARTAAKGAAEASRLVSIGDSRFLRPYKPRGMRRAEHAEKSAARAELAAAAAQADAVRIGAAVAAVAAAAEAVAAARAKAVARKTVGLAKEVVELAKKMAQDASVATSMAAKADDALEAVTKKSELVKHKAKNRMMASAREDLAAAVAAAKDVQSAAAAAKKAAQEVKEATGAVKHAVAQAEEVKKIAPQETAVVFKAGTKAMTEADSAATAAAAATRAARAATVALAEAEDAMEEGAEDVVTEGNEDSEFFTSEMNRLEESIEKSRGMELNLSMYTTLVQMLTASESTVSESAEEANAARWRISSAVANAKESLLKAEAASKTAVTAAGAARAAETAREAAEAALTAEAAAAEAAAALAAAGRVETAKARARAAAELAKNLAERMAKAMAVVERVSDRIPNFPEVKTATETARKAADEAMEAVQVVESLTVDSRPFAEAAEAARKAAQAASEAAEQWEENRPLESDDEDEDE